MLKPLWPMSSVATLTETARVSMTEVIANKGPRGYSGADGHSGPSVRKDFERAAEESVWKPEELARDTTPKLPVRRLSLRVEECFQQARRVYDGAVFEAKKEILVHLLSCGTVWKLPLA